ncbi:hypothetical protein MRX96_015780 [Rhipicephalus microplus]
MNLYFQPCFDCSILVPTFTYRSISIRKDDLRTYAQFKQAAKVYQKRKVDFHAHMPGWTSKSPDLQNFTIAESV